MPEMLQAESQTEALLGDLSPLLEQIGSPAGMSALASTSAFPRTRISSLPEFEQFLSNYTVEVLARVDIPVIEDAYRMTSSNQLRELIASDRLLAENSHVKHFASASRKSGQAQLLRLRPLKDNRFVQRYLDAVERGEANGWHTIAYGVNLAVYSLPLRQGLHGYTSQITQSFIRSASRDLRLKDTAFTEIQKSAQARLNSIVESLLTSRTPALS
jgi:urease accessory protein UreF